MNERWRARRRAWSRSQEHEGVVTYIVYVRVCLYRLLATVYIFYLSAHLERHPWRLQHSRLPAPGRLRPPPSLTARRHERRFSSSKRASCMCHFVLDSLCGVGVAEVYARLGAAFPMHHTHQTYAANTCCRRRTQPPSIRYGMYVTWTVATKYPNACADDTHCVSTHGKQDSAKGNRKRSEEGDRSPRCVRPKK